MAQNNSAGASILEFEEADRDGDTSDNLVTSSNEEVNQKNIEDTDDMNPLM